MYKSPSPSTNIIPRSCLLLTSREIHSREYETRSSLEISSCRLFTARTLFASFSDDNNTPLSLISMLLRVSGRTVTIDYQISHWILPPNLRYFTPTCCCDANPQTLLQSLPLNWFTQTCILCDLQTSSGFELWIRNFFVVIVWTQFLVTATA